MSTTPETPHVTHLIDAYLAGGLEEADRTAVEAHVAECTACAAVLDGARKTERELAELFASARPAAGFEDRLLTRLRPAMLRPASRWNRHTRHPLVRRIAIGVAATVVLGGVGFGMQMGLQAVQQANATGNVRAESDLRNIDGRPYFRQDAAQSRPTSPTDASQSSIASDGASPNGEITHGYLSARTHRSDQAGRFLQRTSQLEQDEKGRAESRERFDVTLGTGAGQSNAKSLNGGTYDGRGVTLLYGDKDQVAKHEPGGDGRPNFDDAPNFDYIQQQQGQGAPGEGGVERAKSLWVDLPKPGQPAQVNRTGAGTLVLDGTKEGDKSAVGVAGGGGGGGGGIGGPGGGGYGGFGSNRGTSNYRGTTASGVSGPSVTTSTEGAMGRQPVAQSTPAGTPALRSSSSPEAAANYGVTTWNAPAGDVKDVRDRYGWQELPKNPVVAGKLAVNETTASSSYTRADPSASSGGLARQADPATGGLPVASKPRVPEEPKSAPQPVTGVVSDMKVAQDAEKASKLLEAPPVQVGAVFRPADLFSESRGSEKSKSEAGQTFASSGGTILGLKDRVAEREDVSGVTLRLAGDKPRDPNAPTAGPTGEGAPSNAPVTPAVTAPEAPAAGVPTPTTPAVPSPAPQTPPDPVKQEDPGPKVKPARVESPERRPNEPVKRMVIRNGTLQFEVDSFDSALMQMNKIVAEEGGYLSGTSSDKLPNGKVRGVITLRCPPDHLDTLVLKLRGMGDLKSQRIAAEDVTKHFTDLDSQYRAAKAMEKRLLAIIEAGGLVKDLLEAEKQLGVWREKIEVLEGEMRYIQDQVAWSTLTVELMERDVRTPTAAAELETVNTSVETEDVEKSRAEALKAIESVKGRVIDSDLKKFDAGQFSATIVADVAPDSSGTVIDRLRQLGKLARLDITRKTVTKGGEGPIVPGLKVERRDTRLVIALYNLANVAARQNTTLNLAAADVEATYKSVLEQAKASGGRVVSSQLNRPKAQQTVGKIVFEAPSEKADALLGSVRTGVEVMRMEVVTNPDAQNTTDAKRGFTIEIHSLAHVPPRETTTLQIATVNVKKTYDELLEAAKGGGGLILTSQMNEQDPNNVEGTLEFDVLREKWPAISDALRGAGIVVSRNVARSQDAETTVDSKIRLSLKLIDEIRLAPRETVSAVVATATVADTFNTLNAAAKDAGARAIVPSSLNLNDQTNPNGRIGFAIPRENAAKFETALKSAGILITRTTSRQPDAQMNVDTKIGFDVTVIDELQLSPRETVTATIATRQVPESFNALANAAREAGARRVGSSIDNRQVQPQGDLSFSVPKENAAKFEAAMKAAGLVINRSVTRMQDGPMVADGRTGFSIAVRDERTMQPRELHTLSVMTKSVNDRYAALLDALRLLDADVLHSLMRQQGNDQRVGELTFAIRREDRPALEKALSANADVFGHTVQRSPDTQNTVDHRVLYQVTLLDADQQKPRQTYDISAEVTDLEKAAGDIDVLAATVGGRSGASKRFNDKSRGGDIVDVTLDVPTSRTGEVLNALRSYGKVVITNQTRDDSVPEGSLSRARLQIQFHLPTAVGAERGMGESLRLGLNSGLNLVSAAAGYLVTGLIGLVVVLVFLVILWGIFRVARWMRRDRRQDQPPGDGGAGTPVTPVPATV